MGGDLISSSGTAASANVYRFSSKELHVNSGMYYYGYRFYDANLQRWINRDPLGERGFELLRGHWARSLTTDGPNEYLFVYNDPENASHSQGLWCFYSLLVCPGKPCKMIVTTLVAVGRSCTSSSGDSSTDDVPCCIYWVNVAYDIANGHPCHHMTAITF